MPRGWRATTSAVRGLGVQSWFHEHLRKITNYHFSSSQLVRPTDRQSQIFPRLFEVKQLIEMLPPRGKALAY